MPELPEVETTRRSLLAWALHQEVKAVQIRFPTLRTPIPSDLSPGLKHQALTGISRRGKYLILHFASKNLLVHLGMSGSLRRQNTLIPAKKHDHVDIVFKNGDILRYHDPRRFGVIDWAPDAWWTHPLLAKLGIEPLSEGFDGAALRERLQSRSGPIKTVLMNAEVLVGVGNIYASESLFRAGIHPTRPAHSLSLKRADRLAASIRDTLSDALASGGSTLRDYVNSLGNLGAFQLELSVYGRAGESCPRCGKTIQGIRQANRSTYYCPGCQR